MDAETCLKKLQYVGVLAFATTDGQGNPQVRNISAIHYEPDATFLQPGERTSAGNCSRAAGCRCWDTQDTKR